MDLKYNFAAAEIARLAMQVEERGRRFYDDLAARSGGADAALLFQQLASQEDRHRQVFAEIAGDIDRETTTEQYDIDLYEHMRKSFIDILENKAFGQMKPADGTFDLPAALELAIHVEDLSVRIYERMQDSFVEKFHAPIGRIIQEEREHRRSLLLYKKDMQT